MRGKVLGVGFKEVLAGSGRALRAGILCCAHWRGAPRRAIAEGYVRLRRHAKPPSRCVGDFGSAAARAVGSCNLGISTGRRSMPVCSLYDLWEAGIRSGSGGRWRLGDAMVADQRSTVDKRGLVPEEHAELRLEQRGNVDRAILVEQLVVHDPHPDGRRQQLRMPDQTIILQLA